MDKDKEKQMGEHDQCQKAFHKLVYKMVIFDPLDRAIPFEKAEVSTKRN